MRFFIFSFLLLFSFSFSYIGANCIRMDELCSESSCMDAGGNYSSGACVEGENFSFAYYENATGECAILRERCEETSGTMVGQDYGCCMPVFALLAAFGFAVRSPRFK